MQASKLYKYFLVSLRVVGVLLSVGRLGAATADPPQRMTYQGYLTDSSSPIPKVLGDSAPANYDTVFRIWSVKQGGNSSELLWSEQQTVTVDKGYFSVLLGEGSVVGSEPRGNLSDVFHSSNASDRFIEITVKGLSGGDVTLAPRLKLVPSPYSFLSAHSRTADRLIGTDSSNQTVDVLKTSGENVGIGLADGANPNVRLDVNGSTRLRTTLSVGGQTNLEGQTAIGKATAPSATLDVAGTAKVSGAVILGSNLTLSSGTLNVTPTGSNPALQLNHAGNPNYALRFDMDSGKTWIRGTGSTSKLSLGANNKEALFLETSGRVTTNFGLAVNGTDLQLGTGAGRSVGSKTSQRALVHLDGDVLNINYNGDFEGGTRITGNTSVDGNLYFNKLLQNSTDSALPTFILDSSSGGDNWSSQGAQVRIGESAAQNGAATMSMAYTGNGYGLVGAGTTSSDATSGAHLRFYYQPNQQWIYGRNAYGYYMHRTGDQHGCFGLDGNYVYVGIHNSRHVNGWRYATYDGDSNWDFTSDVRLKKDIRDAEPMLDRLMDIKVRRFKWKNQSSEQDFDLGVIAQEVEDLFPELVGEFSEDTQQPSVPLKRPTEPVKTVGYTSFGVLAIKGLQELKAEKDVEILHLKDALAERDARITHLENSLNALDDLKARLEVLSQKVNQ